jgi:hypothetical protein
MTQDQINHLLALPKRVEKDGILEESITFDQQVPFQHKYKLKSPIDDSYTFLYTVDQSAKNHLKLTLHFMDNDTKIGLLRIDFNGQHQNPEDISADLPEYLHPFAGKFFSYDEPHIHCYIEGYKPLAWAKPLENDYPVQNISSPADVLSAFYAFNTMIALETHFTINPILL